MADPMKTPDQALGPDLSPEQAEAAVEELLLRIELCEETEERASLEAELDCFVAVHPGAEQTYRMHLALEEQLEALSLEAFLRVAPPVSPLRDFFRRLRARFLPGPVG